MKKIFRMDKKGGELKGKTTKGGERQTKKHGMPLSSSGA